MSTAADHAPVVSRREETIILWLACTGMFMVILDVSVVNVALPSIGRSLHYSPTGLQWVVNAYVLTFAGFLLLGGRAADLYGRRRAFLFGTLIFTASSLIGGLALSAGMLTGARVAQGLGCAFLAPATLTIIITTFKGQRLVKALGAWAAVSAAGGAVGSLFGGILTAELSWRWVLFINVPIGMALMIGALIWLPELTLSSTSTKLDVPGAVLVTAGLSALVYAIVNTATHPWGSGTTLIWLSISSLLLLAFAVYETSVAKSPLIPFRFVIKRTTASTSFVMFVLGVVTFSFWYFMTLYLQEVLGFSALKTGFAFLPMALTVALGAQVTTTLMAKVGVWRLILASCALASLGFFWLAQLSGDGTYFKDALWPGMLCTFTFGLITSPLVAAATSHAGASEAGLASGIMNTSRQIGGAVGLAVLATIAVDATTHALGGVHPSFSGTASEATKAALAHGFSMAYLASSVVWLVGVGATFLIPRQASRAMTHGEAESPTAASREAV